jgi:hypothetical protein
MMVQLESASGDLTHLRRLEARRYLLNPTRFAV